MLRNFIFSIIFFSGITLISIFFLPALLLPSKITLFGGKLMGYWTGFCLRIILSVKITVCIKGNNFAITDKFIHINKRFLHHVCHAQTYSSKNSFVRTHQLCSLPKRLCQRPLGKAPSG